MLVVGCFFLFSLGLQAQEALRASLAGQAAAEQKKQALTNEKYNLEWGPVALRAQASFATEATDNVKLTYDNKEADVVFRPQVNLLSSWQVSDKNRITLGCGIGYAKYLKTTEYDTMIIAPNSELSFDLYVQDFLINFHDRFSYSQDVSTDPTISGIGSLERFVNLSGVEVMWDLNKAVLSLGYDHSLYLATDPVYKYQNYGDELFLFRAGFSVAPALLAGLEVGGGLKHYDQNILNDNQHVSIGPFASARLSDYCTLRASAGYTAYVYDDNGSPTNSNSTLSGFYADLSFRQRVNAVWSQSLSAGRQLQGGIFGENTDIIYVRHEAQWRIIRQVRLDTSLSFERVVEGSQVTETSNRYGFGLTLARPITANLSSSLAYQFYWRDSNITTHGYVQNRLVLDLIYAF